MSCQFSCRSGGTVDVFRALSNQYRHSEWLTIVSGFGDLRTARLSASCQGSASFLSLSNACATDSRRRDFERLRFFYARAAHRVRRDGASDGRAVEPGWLHDAARDPVDARRRALRVPDRRAALRLCFASPPSRSCSTSIAVSSDSSPAVHVSAS